MPHQTKRDWEFLKLIYKAAISQAPVRRMLLISRRHDTQMRTQGTGLSRDKEMHGSSTQGSLHMDLKQDSESSSLTHTFLSDGKRVFRQTEN